MRPLPQPFVGHLRQVLTAFSGHCLSTTVEPLKNYMAIWALEGNVPRHDIGHTLESLLAHHGFMEMAGFSLREGWKVSFKFRKHPSTGLSVVEVVLKDMQS